MTFCKKCGTKIDDGVKFCPKCGATAEQQAQTQQAPPAANRPGVNMNDISAKIASFNKTADTTASFNKADIEQNKVMAILAYFGPLCFVPMFAAKESKFARFHANQGLVAFILNLGYGIIQLILTLLLQAIFPLRWTSLLSVSRGIGYGILTTVLSLLWIPLAVLVIIGIINAANGKAKELPVIGRFKILK